MSIDTKPIGEALLLLWELYNAEPKDSARRPRFAGVIDNLEKTWLKINPEGGENMIQAAIDVVASTFGQTHLAILRAMREVSCDPNIARQGMPEPCSPETFIHGLQSLEAGKMLIENPEGHFRVTPRGAAVLDFSTIGCKVVA